MSYEVRPPFARVRTTFTTTGESMTRQEAKDECDINNIMKKFERTGMLDHRNQFQGQYGDYTNVPTDYHSAMNQVVAAEEMFLTVPAKVRAKFGNDPGAFLAFVSDPKNQDEMIELGLATRQQLEEPMKVEVIEKTPRKEAKINEAKKTDE